MGNFMRNKILLLILISFIYSSSCGQFHTLVLKNKIENKVVCVKKNHGIIIYVDSTKYEGRISDITKDSIEIRIYGRNPNKIEYDTVPMDDSQYDYHIKQGWYCKPEPSYYNNSDLINKGSNNHIRIFYRSTDFEKFSFKNINYFQYRKTESTDGPNMEFLIAGIGLLTSPIWLNTGEKPNWTLFFVCAGIVSADVVFMLIRNNRSKMHDYNFNEWAIRKIK